MVLILGKASELPPCNSVEIAYVYSTFLDEVQDVAEIGQDFESPAVMIDYGDAHIALAQRYAVALSAYARNCLKSAGGRKSISTQMRATCRISYLAIHLSRNPVRRATDRSVRRLS